MSRKRRNFSSKFKADVVLSIIGGQASASEVCRKHGLKPDLVSRWKGELVERAHTVFGNGGEESEYEARIAELERLVGRKELELEIFKKASSVMKGGAKGSGRWS